ncbi:MAG: amino acid permease [Candidatus Aminicenantales bacterium]
MKLNPRDKPNSPNPGAQTRLARDLSLGAAISVGVGTMIGAGIFILPGIVASKAGPAVLISFATCGLVAVLIALCMAELSTGMPYAGGGYLFVVRAFGPLVGSIMGWCLWLSLIFASAFYMIGFGYYVGDALGLPPVGIALAMTAFLGLLNFIGAKETGGTQLVIVIMLLSILLSFFFRAILSVDVGRMKPFVPPEIGFTGVLITLPILFITFLGFAEISAISEEVRNPGRNLPRSLVGSVVIVTIVYCAVVFCILGLRKYNDPSMASETVLMDLARMLLGHVGYFLILLGGILATVSSANASVMAASRISFAMGRDELLPYWFNQIHFRFKTPYRSIGVTTVLTMLLLVTIGGHLELLAEVAGFLSLVLYGLITLACMLMRYAKLDWYKPTFQTPGYPVVPLLGLLGCVFVIANTSRATLLIGNMIIAASFIWYVLFLRKQTQLRGASNILLQQKVIKPLVVRAEEYLNTRGEILPMILVPLANPETERSLLALSTALARRRKARLQLIHVINVPIQTPLGAGRVEYDKLRKEKETLLDMASRHAAELGIRARTSAIVAHNVPSAILSVADTSHTDFIVMGWRGEVRAPRVQRTSVAAVLKVAKENVIVLKDRGLERVRRILVPLRGGSHAQLGLSIAHELAQEWGATITAFNVQVGTGPVPDSSEFDRESVSLFKSVAEDFVRDTAVKAGVPAEIKVAIHKDVARAIVEEAEHHDLIVMGASNEWTLRRWLFGSLPDQVANLAPVSVIMVRGGRSSGEQPSPPEETF